MKDRLESLIKYVIIILIWFFLNFWKDDLVIYEVEY